MGDLYYEFFNDCRDVACNVLCDVCLCIVETLHVVQMLHVVQTLHVVETLCVVETLHATSLRQNPFYQFAMDVGKAETTTLEFVGKAFMVNS